MRSGLQPTPTRHPSLQVLVIAIVLIGLGVVLLLLSVAWNLNPALQPVGKGLRTAVPYVFLAGFALLVVYAVIRPAADPAHLPTNETALFGKDSTDFASQQNQTIIEDSPAPAGHPGER